ncbi:MAG: AtpZ/AtpI family protein [Patescibacteria group bacterium]
MDNKMSVSGNPLPLKPAPAGKNYSWPTVARLVAVLSAWIVFPVLIGLFLGQWLDQKYNTSPWLFLITTGVAFLISMFGLIINALKELKRIEGDSLKKDEALE